MAFKINGSTVIPSGFTFGTKPDIENITDIDTGTMQKFFGSGGWNEAFGSFTHANTSTATTYDLRAQQCWPQTKDFREAVFEIRCTAMSGGSNTYSFNGSVTWEIGTNYENEPLISFANYTNVGNQAYIHVVFNGAQNSSVYTYYLAHAYQKFNSQTGYLDQLTNSYKSFFGFFNWGSFNSSDQNTIRIAYPTHSSPSMTWTHKCYYR
jgi:hypothetical protein